MMSIQVYLVGLFIVLAFATVTWFFSLLKKDASIVDPVWSLFFLGLVSYFNWNLGDEVTHPRQIVLSILVTLWALRLSIYLFWRNWRRGEDYRYQAMRKNAGENVFWWKSFFRVFLLQGFLAWIISSTLFATYYGDEPWNIVDYLAGLVWLIGFIFEVGGDWQLMMFKSRQKIVENY